MSKKTDNSPETHNLDGFIFDFDENFNRTELTEEDYLDFSNMSDSITIEKNLTEVSDEFDTTIIQDKAEIGKNNTDLNESVPQPEDDVEIQVNRGIQDHYDGVDDYADIVKVKNPSNGIIPRIRPSSVQTTEQAESFFIAEVRRRFRFNLYDNMIDPLENVEIEDAIYDALEEINQTPPFTSYTLMQLVQRGSRYRRVLILGAAKYCLLNLGSIWAANGINVSIEDLSVDNKTSDMNSLYTTVAEQYQEALTQMKEYDRLAVSQSTFSTGSRKFGATGNLTSRVSTILRTGGRLG